MPDTNDITALLAELERLSEQATPRAWGASTERGDAVITQFYEAKEIPSDEIDWYGGKLICESMRSADIALIVALRNGWPALRDHIQRLQAAVDDAHPIMENALLARNSDVARDWLFEHAALAHKEPEK